MFLEENIVSTLAIAFFIICIILLVHLSFFVSNGYLKKRIYTYPLMYGIFISTMEIIKYRNTPYLIISPSRAIGGTIGLIAGFYFGYQFCILIKIIDDNRFIESLSDIDKTVLTGSSHSKSIATAISIGFSEAGRQLGSFLGEILFSI
jgi:hypothetical protein